MIEVLADDIVEEHIHGQQFAPLRVMSVRIPGTVDDPPLAVERTVLPDMRTGPPIILVHGFAQNRYTWRVSQRSLSGRLALEGFDVWNLELRGHGNSRAYGAGNATAFEQYVRDLVRTVAVAREESGGRAPFVMGHSLGGGVAVAASTLVPLAGVVHVAGVYVFATGNPFLRLLAGVTQEARPLLTTSRIRMSTGWAGRLVSRLYGFTDATGYAFPVSGWAPGSVERDLLDERLTKGFDWTSVEVWLEMAEWARGREFPYAPAFRTTDVPLLVIAGDADTLLMPKDAKRCFDESGSTDKHYLLFEPFEHQVHWGHLDLLLGKRAPEFVWPRIVRFLADRAG